jgi:hypothetical protein
VVFRIFSQLPVSGILSWDSLYTVEELEQRERVQKGT